MSDSQVSLAELSAYLERRFNPAAAEGLDATFCLSISTHRLIFRIQSMTLEFTDPEDASSDATFHFDQVQTVRSLLNGQQDIVSCFMEGRFRTDGYILLALRFIAMFRDSSNH